jgi:hypothetical protein
MISFVQIDQSRNTESNDFLYGDGQFPSLKKRYPSTLPQTKNEGSNFLGITKQQQWMPN